jgi:diguanylate cyclase
MILQLTLFLYHIKSKNIMQYDDTIDDSRRHLRLALEYIGRQGLSADPLNYCIWYEYASGKNGDLNAAIDSFLEGERVISAEIAQQLFNQYIADSQIKLTELVREELKKLFAEIIAAIKTSNQHFSQTEGNLESINDALMTNLSETDVDLIVDRIKQEIKRLESTSTCLQEQLQQATHEIEQLKIKMAHYRDEAFKDPLTRIDNRRSFENKLEEVINESMSAGTSLCLIIADIDHFKRINDAHGHLVGDNVLRVVASTIKESIKGKDLVARIGGEEFAILLPDTPFNGAVKLANNIRLAFERMDFKKKNNGETLGKITLSFGVAIYTRDEDGKSFVGRADEALYHSKNSGRNRVTGL